MSQPPQYPQYPSNVPPPGYPQPPSSQPPGGFPPPGSYPQQQQGYPQPAAAGTSVAAVFSLVFGILGCIPLITSVLAVLLGIIGISATKNRRKGGRGLAVAGLVLGLLGVLLWGLFGGGLYTAYVLTGPARTTGKQFMTAMADGDVAKAQTMCAATVTKDELDGLEIYMKPLGKLVDVTSFSLAANDNNGVTTAAMGGSATFANGAKPFTMQLVKENGTWKVTMVQFDPKNTTGMPSGSPKGSTTQPSTE